MAKRPDRRAIARLVSLSRALNRLLEDGSFFRLPRRIRRGLVRRVRRLYRGVTAADSTAARYAVLAAAASMALAACKPLEDNNDNNDPPPEVPVVADNPYFAAAVQNALELVTAEDPPTTAVAPAFADIDGDGDADLFAGAGGEGAGIIAFFENTGSSTAAAFGAPTGYLGLSGDGFWTEGSPVPVLAPLDGDDDFDLFLGHHYYWSNAQYYENDAGTFAAGTVPADLWAGDSSAQGANLATFVDIDNDGDLDAVVSLTDGDGVNTVRLHENTGTAANPVFEDQATSLGLDIPAGTLAFPSFVDIDADGDFDAFLGDEDGNLQFYENTGTKTAAVFAAAVENPFGLAAVPTGPAAPAFVDIDGDDDFDLFVGDGAGDIWFFENTNLPVAD